MRLLDLPDELLSAIILETMWATTTKPSNPPDLLMYERRLTNHASRHRKKVAFVGQICGRLRRVAQAHLKLDQLWEDPDALLEEFTTSSNSVMVDAPSSFMAPSIKGIALLDGQAMFLPQLPSAALENLSDLSITRALDDRVVYCSDKVLGPIGSCKRLENLLIGGLTGELSGTTKLFDDIASIPTLQSLVIESVYTLASPIQALSLALGRTWSAPLVRLEIIDCRSVTLERFLELMGKVATTLQVAIFHHSDFRTYSKSHLTTAVVTWFPQLWRMDIGFGQGAHFRYRDQFPIEDSTRAGRQQLAECSPIAIWKAAPRLEYFGCSEQIVVRTQKELDEISELQRRDGMKRLRVKLDTWWGNKGAGWSMDKIQEIVVG